MGILSYGYKAGKTSTGKKVIETVKNIFKGKSKTSPTISSVPANVSTTKLEKAKSKFNIAKHKTKMSKAKLNQTLFNSPITLFFSAFLFGFILSESILPTSSKRFIFPVFIFLLRFV